MSKKVVTPCCGATIEVEEGQETVECCGMEHQVSELETVGE